MSSGSTPPNDPMQLMRDAYALGIERWSKAMEEIVGSEDFASASGQLLALYAQQQQSMRAASRVAAESIQMPTTEDLAEVAQLVINVERKLDEANDQSADLVTRLGAIEEKLAALADAATASQAVSERLARIEAGIAELAQRPVFQAPAPTAIQEPRATPVPTPAPVARTEPAAAKQPAAKKPATKKPATKKPAAKKAPAKARAGGASASGSTPARRRTPPADG